MRWPTSHLPRCLSRIKPPHYSIGSAPRYLSTLTSNDHNIAAALSKDPAESNALHPTRVVGTVRTIRNQKRHSFVEIGDGSTSRSLQALLEPHQAEGQVYLYAVLGTGTSVALTGIWQCSPPGKEQENELRVDQVSILGPTDAEEYPLQKKFHSTEFLRGLPHLRLRTRLNALLTRLRSECDYQLASYFRNHGFIRLQPPIITSSDCEGAGEVFTVASNIATEKISQEREASVRGPEKFFRDPKYLTVSSQLHLEAYITEHPKVWTLSPTFRAEKSDTPRHLSEFTMLEAEIRTESLLDVMNTVEDMIKRLVADLRSTNVVQELIVLDRRDGIESLEVGRQIGDIVSKRWAELTERVWPHVTYSEAIGILESARRSSIAEFKHEPTWDGGLQLEHERFIATTVGNGSPVFVTDYPQKIKPFYMLPSESTSCSSSGDRATVACFDLLLPDGCEVAGGSLREHRLDHLEHAMQNSGRNPKNAHNGDYDAAASPSTKGGNLDWYVDLRRYGSVPHGGFGLGFDRLLGYLSGIPSIRDVVSWPRYHGRCDC